MLNDDQEMIEYKIQSGHNIKQFCQESVSLIKKMEDKDMENEFIEELKFMQKFIEMIYAQTNDMTFVRYPIDNKKNNKHFYVQPKENIYINLRVLKQWVLRLHQIFDMGYVGYLIDTIT